MKFDRKKYFKILITVLVMAILIGGWVLVEEKNSQFLEINFFDVGQGDATFIETTTGRQILIDGGPSSLILEKLGQVMPFWDRTIDLIILSHPEHDHFGGLIEVIKRYKVGVIMTTGVIKETAEYEEWRQVIADKKIPRLMVQAGETIKIDEESEVVVLYPRESLAGQIVKGANNSSLVVQFKNNNFALLLTGDIEKKAENILLSSGENLSSDVLKVPHHGSRTSSTVPFLKAVNPQLAVIQVGRDNPYGHPSPVVLERLKNITVLNTADRGDIKIFTNGLRFWVK